MKLETILIHAGGDPDPETGAIAPPLNLSTTFEHGPTGEIPHGYIYIREGNPTQSRLEDALAKIEGGFTSRVFASGMAAGAAYLQSLALGSHVIFHEDIYYGFREIAINFFESWGFTYSIVDMTDQKSLEAAMRPETKLLWIETPSNPLLDILDIPSLAEIAHQNQAKLLVDGTFATPVLQQPLNLGADIVLHAATKYLGGHSDVQGGALIFSNQDPNLKKIEQIRSLLGAVLSPFNSWLILRGLRTLACRMERHSHNALTIAHWLDSHHNVEKVHYPGLPSNPGHKIARVQMNGYGGMLSFQVKGSQEDAFGVASRLQLFLNATSLGGVESLLEHRASSEGPSSTAPPNLLRVSVGLEAVEDLLEDLQQALDF